MAGTTPHKHCMVCGNAIDDRESFCDELCQSKLKSSQRRQQILFIVFIILFVMMLILPAILSMKG